MVLSLLNVPRQRLNEFEHAPVFLRFSLNDVDLLLNDCDICILVSWACLLYLNHTSDSWNIWLRFAA